MVQVAGEGRLQALYVVGENPMMSEPDLGHARRAFSRIGFLAVEDIFLTETALRADVVLPAACFAEKEGTFTSTERRIQLVRRALLPPGEAREDWRIVTGLAARCGRPMDYASSAAVMEEIAALAPIYGGVRHGRLAPCGGLQWPCWDERHPGAPRLHAERFTRGRGKFHAVEYRPPAEEPSADYPVVLTTGRVLEHWHTGSMSRRGGCARRYMTVTYAAEIQVLVYYVKPHGRFGGSESGSRRRQLGRLDPANQSVLKERPLYRKVNCNSQIKL